MKRVHRTIVENKREQTHRFTFRRHRNFYEANIQFRRMTGFYKGINE